MDPLIEHIISPCMALLFGTAAVHKIRAPAVFMADMREYRLLPRALVPLTAIALMTLETLGAILVLIPATRVTGSVLLAVLLMVYSTGIGINLLRGRRDIDCGCNGPASRQPITGWLVFRNILLLSLLVLAMLPGNDRPLHWLDFLTIVFAALASCGLYLGFNQLLAQAPRLASLRDGT